MSVRCGNKVHQAEIVDANGHHHDSVGQVRLCYAREYGIESLEEKAYAAHCEDEAEYEAQLEAQLEAQFEADFARSLEARSERGGWFGYGD